MWLRSQHDYGGLWNVKEPYTYMWRYRFVAVRWHIATTTALMVDSTILVVVGQGDGR